MHGIPEMNTTAEPLDLRPVPQTAPQEGLREVDTISARALKTIPARAAGRILKNDQLARECQDEGLDLVEIVAALRRAPADRVKLAGNSNVEMLEMLTRADVRFVLIGGLAGCAYGARGKAKDLDICHSREPENLRRLAAVLHALGAEFRRMPQHVPPALSVDTLLTEMDFVFTTREHGDFDLIGEFTAVGVYENAMEDAKIVKIDGFDVPVLSLPKLAAAKKSTGRPKDLTVWHELRLIQKAIDYGLKRNWPGDTNQRRCGSG